jgi:hypothetical protein
MRFRPFRFAPGLEKENFSPIVPLDLGGHTEALGFRARLRRQASAFGANIRDETGRDGHVDLCCQLSSGGQLVCQEAPAECFCAGAHHDRSARVTAVFPDQLMVVDAGEPLMGAGGSGGCGVCRHDWTFARGLSASDEREELHPLRCSLGSVA